MNTTSNAQYLTLDNIISITTMSVLDNISLTYAAEAASVSCLLAFVNDAKPSANIPVARNSIPIEMPLILSAFAFSSF